MLVLSRGAQRIAAVEFGDDLPPYSKEARITVEEDAKYTLSIENKEPGLKYAVWTGDLALETGTGADSLGDGASLGRSFGPNVLWEDGRYFAGARGRVLLRLGSRDEEDDAGSWTDRLSIPLYVVATKTTEEAFDIMCEELRRLAGGLLFDLVSKSTVGIGESSTRSRPIWYSSSQLELRLLEKLWDRFSAALTQVLDSPWTKLTPVARHRLAYGSEKLDQRASIGLAVVGMDPRRPEVPKPFHVMRTVLEESTNTLEHQIIAGFLDFLRERMRDCIANIELHIKAIVDDRDFRSLPSGAGVSLYDAVDRPRIDKLRQAMTRARNLERLVSGARKAPLLRDVVSRFSYFDTPVFRHVEHYYRIRMLIEQYMSSSLIVLSEGVEERLKSTSRIYEQWVFVQIASAFRAAGLSCASMEGMLNRVRRYRYTLDIDRDAKLTFTGHNGWFVIVRYEPWIHPETAARQSKDEVCRGGTGVMPWSPDILIEFCVESPDPANPDVIVDYAVVVDAKFSRRVRQEQREGVAKYQQIRSTTTRKQVVRQCWIASPATVEDSEISLWDSAVSWTDSGPSCARDEFIDGHIAIVPELDASEVAEDRWLSQPRETALRFVQGLLHYVGVRH